jgi:hypothetical protein
VGTGKPSANIIVDANVLAAIPKVSLDKPNPTSRVQRVAWAAHDLQLYIEKISGAKLPIIGDDQTVPGGVRILVGLSKYAKRYQDEIPAGLSNHREKEGYTILTRSNTLVLAGNEEAPYHGTEYAVGFFYISLAYAGICPANSVGLFQSAITLSFRP